MAEELRDIQSIPYFAYSPGLYEWIVLLAGFGLASLIFTFLSRRKRKSNFHAIDRAILELDKLRSMLFSGGSAKETIFAASIIARRMASHLEEDEISILSQKELENKKSAANPELRILLEPIIEIERHKYAPALSTEDAGKLLNSLIASVHSYRNARNSKVADPHGRTK